MYYVSNVRRLLLTAALYFLPFPLLADPHSPCLYPTDRIKWGQSRYQTSIQLNREFGIFPGMPPFQGFTFSCLQMSRCGFLLQGFKEFSEGSISESQK